MIVAKNADAANYKGFSPLLDRALDLLTPEFLAGVGTETVHLDGDRLYATLNLFETAPDSETFFESHKLYLDIHVVTKGEERMEIADPATLTLDEAKSNPGGDFYVSSGGTATLVKENGGNVFVANDADATFVQNELAGLTVTGRTTLHSATTAANTTVEGGELAISGGVATDTTVNGGAIAIYYSGTADNTTLNNGGAFLTYCLPNPAAFILSVH